MAHVFLYVGGELGNAKNNSGTIEELEECMKKRQRKFGGIVFQHAHGGHYRTRDILRIKATSSRKLR